MRALVFRVPRFQCRVRQESDQTEETRIEAAHDEAELRRELADRGYQVLSTEVYDIAQWKIFAAGRMAALDTAARPYKFDNEVWRRIKQFLFSLSNDKCGYCEGEVLTVSAGEVEHYRPKAKVNGDESHPGYYWLAYDIDNYIPTCALCNSSANKGTHFPVAGTRARSPADPLDMERPLLLHPFKEDPAQHLRFIVGTEQTGPIGAVVGLTPIGKTSVEVYGLRRGPVEMARRRAIEKVFLELEQSYFHPERFERLLSEIKTGKRPYASACLAAVVAWLDNQSNRVNQTQASLAGRRAGSPPPPPPGAPTDAPEPGMGD